MRIICIIFSIICLLAAITAQASTPYQMIRLGFLPGDSWGEATQINNSGQIIGQSRSDSTIDCTNVFLWSQNTGLVDIRVDGELDRPGGINDLGQMTGVGLGMSGASAYIRQSNGYLSALPKPDGRIDTCGMNINNSGQVVGWLRDLTNSQNSPYYAALWNENGEITTLGGGDDLWSRATDINNNGQVIWTREVPLIGQQAYIWDRTNGSVPLALLDGTTSNSASSLNDSGIIVGCSGDHAVVWNSNGSVIRDLGLGHAFGINESGQIVGTSGDHAVLWNPDGSIAADLGASAAAYGINNSGQIVGSAVYDQYGDREAVLWQPVPEPSSLAVLLCGLTGVGTIIRRRKS